MISQMAKEGKNMGAPENHSEYGGSSAHRWTTCTASIKEIRRAPNVSQENEYTAEGTLAHGVAALALSGDIDVGKLKYRLPDEIIVMAKRYADFVFDTLGEWKDTLHIEELVFYDHWGVKGGFGTVDAYGWTKDTAHLWDYKYGKGVKVDARNNKQLLTYAAGVRRQLIKNDVHVKKYHLHIFQLRMGNIETWKVDASVVNDWCDVIGKAYAESQENPQYTPTMANCRWCPALLTCPASNEFVKDEIRAGINMDESDLQKVLKVLRQREVVYAYLRKAEEQITNMLQTGIQIDGVTLGKGKSRRKLVDGANEVLEQVYGEQVYRPKELKTITDLRAFVDPLTLDEVTYKQEGKPKLVFEEEL